MLQVVSGSCEELTLPFLVVVCWNFGWFAFFPDSSSLPNPRSKSKQPTTSSCCCGGCSRLRYWLPPSLTSVHLYGGELQSLYI